MSPEPDATAGRVRRLLADVLERHPAPGLVFDEAGVLTHANRAAQELLGGDDLAGTRLAELFREDAAAEDGLAPLSSLLAERSFLRVPLEEERHGLAGCVVLEAAAGRQDERAGVLEALAGLAGGVAHDFNNHLTAILSHGSLARERLERPEEVRAHLEQIGGAARRARMLTQQLLAFSRRQVTHRSEVEVGPALERARRRILAAHRGVDAVHVDAPEALPAGRADPGALERLLEELARVVLAAAPTTRELTLAARLDAAEGALELTVGPAGGALAARAGLDAEALAPLARTTGTRLSWGPGGASVRLAVLGAPHASAAARGPIDEAAILLVEDDEAVRAVVGQVLARAGFRVRSAPNGARALELAAAPPRPGLLISDVRLPGMNGLELYERLAMTSPGLRVLFVSGMVEDGSLRERLGRPGLAFLQKPFAADELLARVREVLAAEPPAVRTRVLVVDDEPAVRELVPLMLAGSDYDCTSAASATEALALCEEQGFAVVLCDVVMPERDGLELVRELRQRRIPARVLAMSGHRLGSAGLAAARELGAVTTLTKPFSRDELLLALSRARQLPAA